MMMMNNFFGTCALMAMASVSLAATTCKEASDCPKLGECLSAICREEVCNYQMSCDVAKRQQRGASVRSDDGSVTVIVEEGKTFGYKVGDDKEVTISDMPEAFRAYTDASVTTLGLGYELGAVKADALVTKAKLELTKDINDVKTDLNSVKSDAQDILDEGARKQAAQLQQFNTTMKGVIAEATEAGGAAKAKLDKMTSCNYPVEYFDSKSSTCAKAVVCTENQIIHVEASTFVNRKCEDHKKCDKDEYRAVAGTKYAHPICRKVSKSCIKGYFQTKEANATHDITCDGVYSCYEINALNKKAKSGVYTILVDTESLDMTKTNTRSEAIEVFCNRYDGDKFFTIFEMIKSDQTPTNYYNWYSTDGRYPSASSIGERFKENQNQASRLAAVEINSIFKHSYGYVQTRYANNREDYMLTDIFGTPAKGKHLLHASNKCGDRSRINIAKTYRAPDSHTSMGYCMNDGQRLKASNCFCGDTTNGNFQFNRCSGSPQNWVRYNAKESENLKCSNMHRKCYNHGNHFTLGDTYSCNKGGQRTVGSHMWFFYSNGHRGWGAPCVNSYHYGCYASRWIW